VEVVDPLTVKMTIEKGMGPFLSYLALLNRSAIIHADSYDASGNATTIIGTGPFFLDSFRPGESYTLKKFDQYWKEGEPYLDEVVLRVITDAVVRLNALRSGEIDMAEELPIADVKQLLDNPDPNFTVEVYYFNSGARLNMNHTRPPFDNIDARKAVQYAFDREMYNEAVYFGLGQVHNQPFVPEDVWYLDVPGVEPDLELAREHFAAAGLEEGTEINIVLMANQRDAGDIIDAMLSQVGFRANLEIVDSAAWNTRGQALDYDMIIGTMTGIFDPDRPYGYLTNSSGGNWLVGGYGTPEMDELLTQGVAEVDVEARKEIYSQVVNKVQEDVATMYLLGLPWVEGWQNYVVGYRPGTSPVLMMMDASDGLNTTWLDK
jgi:peptide/nickel transport system substrate-binding protein